MHTPRLPGTMPEENSHALGRSVVCLREKLPFGSAAKRMRRRSIWFREETRGMWAAGSDPIADVRNKTYRRAVEVTKPIRIYIYVYCYITAPLRTTLKTRFCDVIPSIFGSRRRFSASAIISGLTFRPRIALYTGNAFDTECTADNEFTTKSVDAYVCCFASRYFKVPVLTFRPIWFSQRVHCEKKTKSQVIIIYILLRSVWLNADNMYAIGVFVAVWQLFTYKLPYR